MSAPAVLAVLDRIASVNAAFAVAGMRAMPSMLAEQAVDLRAVRSALAELIEANRELLAGAPAHMTPRNAREREAYKAIRAFMTLCDGAA